VVVRGVLFGSSILAALVVWSWRGGFEAFGADARAYYEIDPLRPYVADEYAYVWSPAFAQLTAALRLLPFESFLALVRGLDLVAAVVLAPFGAWAALMLPPVASESASGNINLILAACVVFGLRWPVLWTLPLLTKPSLAVGLLWFAARGDWRRLLWGVLPAAVIAAASFLYAPGLWFDWFAFLGTMSLEPGWPFPIAIWIRLPIAVALVVWGARTDRPWAAVLGAIIAMPRLYFMSPAMLLAVLPALSGRYREAVLGRQPSAVAVSWAVSLVRHRRGASVPIAPS
jgi:hypothetical protein